MMSVIQLLSVSVGKKAGCWQALMSQGVDSIKQINVLCDMTQNNADSF